MVKDSIVIYSNSGPSAAATHVSANFINNVCLQFTMQQEKYGYISCKFKTLTSNPILEQCANYDLYRVVYSTYINLGHRQTKQYQDAASEQGFY